MIFRGLPTDMKTGCVDVRPKTKTSLPLLPCGLCKFYHVEYFMCDLGHVTCRDCGNDELNRVCASKVESSCWGCGQRMKMRRISITTVQLLSEKWCCPCGYSGTLKELSCHLREAKYTSGCVLLDKSIEELELNHFKRMYYFLEDARALIELAEDRVAFLFNKQLVKRWWPNFAPPNDMAVVEQYSRIVSTKLSNVRAAIKDVHVMNNETLDTLEAIFRKDSWVFLSLDEVLSSSENNYRTVISGVPVGIRTKHEIHDDQLWLGIFLRGLSFKAVGRARRDNCYPLKLDVSVRLHDNKGYVAAKESFVTYANGKYSCPSFKNPTLENVNYAGIPKLVSLDQLRHGYPSIGGKLCFSFRFDPLYEVD